MIFKIEDRLNTMRGLIFVGFFSLCATYISKFETLANFGLSSLVIAIILGIIYGNTLHERISFKWKIGIQFSAKQILRLAIILYGFRVSFQEIASVGAMGLIIDMIVVSVTLIGGSWIGIKFFKLDKHLAILIASGSAICGAAAVLAIEGVLKSDPYKSSIAVGTVLIFGTISMFLYPFLQDQGILDLTEQCFGIFIGASTHEVAQALVAGNHISPDSGNIAVIVKMTRVLLLIPALIGLSFYLKNSKDENVQQKFSIPWFAIIFALVIAFNSLKIISLETIYIINKIDLFLLTMAMSAIGIETNIGKIKTVGLNPLYCAAILFLWLGISVFFLVSFIK